MSDKPIEITRTVLQGIDFKSQSKQGEYIVFTPNNSSFPVVIDTFTTTPHFEGFLDGALMVALPINTKWIVYHRSLLKEITQEDVIKMSAEKHIYQEKMEEEIVGPHRKAAVAKLLAGYAQKGEVVTEEAHELDRGHGVYL